MKSAGLGKKQSAILPIEKWEVKNVENNVKDIKSLLSNNEGWETIMLDQSTIANLATLQIAGLEKPECLPQGCCRERRNGYLSYFY